MVFEELNINYDNHQSLKKIIIIIILFKKKKRIHTFFKIVTKFLNFSQFNSGNVLKLLPKNFKIQKKKFNIYIFF